MCSAVAVAIAFVSSGAMIRATEVEDVCQFPLSRMFAADPDRIYSRLGFIECLNTKNETNPLCDECTCRELQYVQNGGSLISWGYCIKNHSTTTCSSPQTDCNASTVSAPSPVAFLPHAVQPGVPASPQPSSNTSSGSHSTGALVAIAVCSIVLALGAIAFVIFRRRRSSKPLVFPPSPTDYSNTVSSPPLKFSTPRFADRHTRTRPTTKPRHDRPPSLSADDLVGSRRRDTFETGDFVSMASSSDRRREIRGASGAVQTLDPRLRKSFVSAIGADTMRSMSAEYGKTDRQQDSANRSQLIVYEESEIAESRESLDLTMSSASAFASRHWSRDSEDSTLFSVSSSSGCFSATSSPRQSLEI